MHLALVGGFVFLAVRGGLALIPPVALRYPIKKIARRRDVVVMFLLPDDFGRRRFRPSALS